MNTHTLKTKQPYFDLVASGVKKFEVRQYTEQTCKPSLEWKDYCEPCKLDPDNEWGRCDNPKPARDFQVGDTLFLMLKDGETSEYCTDAAGNKLDGIQKRISYVLKDTDYPEGIQPGYCILGLE